MSEVTNAKSIVAWSYTKLKTFEDCPRRYYECDVLKAWGAEQSDMLDEGDRIHKAMARRLMDGTTLPIKYRIYEPWVAKVEALKGDTGELLVEDEARWACTKLLRPVPWFAKSAWLRCIADAVVFDPPLAVVFDWKTGRSSNVDPVQMTLLALMTMLHFPEVRVVKGYFIWLNEGTFTEAEIYRKDAMRNWRMIMERAARLEKATVDKAFPPRPGKFCRRWCRVRNCEYHGK